MAESRKMTKKDSAKHRFNKPLYIMYQSTSDDLMFWCWFDVLILSVNFGFDSVQISLLFTVSFWVALAMKVPGGFLAKRLGAGRSVMLSAVLFLAAALLLTFGRTMAVAILGQSIYLVAIGFQEMSSAILKKAAQRDPVHIDYMRIMSVSAGIYAGISLAASLLMSKLFNVNANLPMYICIGFCLCSCVMAYYIGRYDIENEEEENMDRRETLPGLKVYSLDRTTLSCLFLSILFMGIFSVSGNFFKIAIEDGLEALNNTGGTVFLFSMVLLASRVVKIISNLIMYISRKGKINPELIIKVVVPGVIMIPALGCLGIWQTGYGAVVLITAGFLVRVLVFDPFHFTIYDFMLKRLKNDKMTEVLFIHSIGADLFTALLSTISTVLLKFHGMRGVMLLLLLVSVIMAAGYFLLQRNLRRTNGNRAFLKWDKTKIRSQDSLMVASAALFMHYGVIQDTLYTPEKLEKKISSVEEIHTANRKIQFEGFCDYDEDILKKLFDAGHPCAIRAVIREGDPERWLPVLYLDDDGGVVWNPYSEEPFIARFAQISEICSFTI